MIDRRVCLDIIGNVLHGLCFIATVRRERSGTCMTQTQQAHRVRSGHLPWVSASGRHIPEHEGGNLRAGY